MSLIPKGFATAASTSVAIPTHAVGDLIIVTAYRDGSTAIPTKPSASGTIPAWVTIDGPVGANLCSMISACFVATATNHTTGTWSNATGISVAVYSGQKAGTGITAIGGHAQGGSASTSVVDIGSFGVVTLQDASGNSAIHRIVGVRTVTAWGAAPTGWTLQAQTATEIEILTKDVTTSEAATGTNQTNTFSASGGFRCQGIEILVGTTPVAQSVAVSYNVAKQIPKTLPATYNVRSQVAPTTLALIYDVNVAIPVWTELGEVFVNSGGGSFTNISITRDQDPGTILVVAAAYSASGSIGCSDSKFNAYNTESIGTNGPGHQLVLFSSKPPTAKLLKTGDTITISFPSTANRQAVIFQVSNLDQTTWVANTVTAGSPGSATTALDSGNLSLAPGHYEMYGVSRFSAGDFLVGNNGQGKWYTYFGLVGSSGNGLIGSQHMQLTVPLTANYKAASTLTVGSFWIQTLLVFKVAVTTTTVNKSVALNYNVRQQVVKTTAPTFTVKASVAKSLALNYSVRKQISQTKALAYNVVSLGTVAKSLSLAYTVRKQASKSVALAYFVRSAVPVKSVSPAYIVRRAISKTTSPAYYVRKIVVKTTAANYALRNVISKPLTAVYNVRISRSTTFALNYAVKQSVVKSQALTYFTRRSVPTTARSISYNIRPPAVIMTLNLGYQMSGGVKVGLALSYQVQQITAKTLPISYSIRTRLAKSLPVNYNIRVRIPKLLPVSYHTRITVSKSYTASYRLINTISKSRSFSYTVKRLAARQVAPSYRVQQRVPKALSVAYRVSQRLSKPLAVGYSVRVRVAKATSVSYRLRAVLAKTPQFTYNVRKQVSTSRAISFRLRVVRAKPLVLTYKLQAQVRRTVTATYGVSGHLHVTFVLNYRVRTDILVPGDDPLSGKFSAALLSARIPNWAGSWK